MRAVQIKGINELTIADVPSPKPEAGEAVVSIKAAALNHRDVWIKVGQYAGLKYPCIPGSDGAGVVT
ncbi:MAG: alcohol dehydrogenase catalytic domain-containing protein, partial [Opitutus sp.]